MESASSKASAVESSACEHLAGKYLTFALAEENFGFPILRVQEIICATHITKVPRSPAYLRGVINLRGKLIPVIDLRMKLGLEFRPYDSQACFIVVNTTLNGQEVAIGVAVDRVLEVVDLEGSAIQSTPEYGSYADTSTILALGKVGERAIVLLDVHKTIMDGKTEHVALTGGTEKAVQESI